MIYSKEIAEAKNGSKIPLFKNGKPANSKYNPDAEQILFESSTQGCIIVAGIAGGFHIEKLLNEKNISLIIAVEADSESLEFCKQFSSVKKISESNKAILCDKSDLEKILCTKYFPALYKNLTLVFHRAWKNENPQIAQEISSTVKNFLEKVSADYSVQAHLGKIWQRNILLNLKFISKHKNENFFSANIKKGKIKKTAAIVAAGPTLDFSIEEIKHGDFFVISTDTAFGTLLQNSIIPDVVINIDAQHISSEHFFCTGEETRTTFVFDLCSNPESVYFIYNKKNKIQFCINQHPLSLIATKNMYVKKIESGAGTVTIAAADWAKSCGFQKLKFFGADFSYNFGKPYTKGTYLEKQFFSKSNRLISAEEKHIALMFRTELEKIQGQKNSFTTEVLKRYKKSLEEWAEKNSFKFKNGIYISEKKIETENFNTKNNFNYSDFHREFTNKIKELLKNPEPEVILKSDWGLSILPILAFFKNNTLFDSLKLAYNQALRYN